MLAAPDRPRLGIARLQHAVTPPEDPEDQHPLSLIGRTTVSSIASTGIRVENEGEWSARDQGSPKRGVCRKLHIGINESKKGQERSRWGASPTNTGDPSHGSTTGNVDDAPMPYELVNQIPSNQGIASVTTDGAFDIRECQRHRDHSIPQKRQAPGRPTPGCHLTRKEAY